MTPTEKIVSALQAAGVEPSDLPETPSIGWLKAYADRFAAEVIPPLLRGPLRDAPAAQCTSPALHAAAVDALQHRGKHSHRATAAMHASVAMRLAEASMLQPVDKRTALQHAAAANLASAIEHVTQSGAAERAESLLTAAQALRECQLDVGYVP